MRTATPLSELQRSILKYLQKRSPGGELYDLRVKGDPHPSSHVPFTASALLEHKPTGGERAGVAGSLAALEQRGLIIRVKSGEKGVRTTRLILTGTGLTTANKLLAEGEPLKTEQTNQDPLREQLEQRAARLGAALRALDAIPKNGTGRLQSDAAIGAAEVYETLLRVQDELKELEG